MGQSNLLKTPHPQTFISLEMPNSPIYSGSAEHIAGVDEVGRGAIFGPVVAAAVILPESCLAELSAAGVTDSKLLSARKRQNLAHHIQRVAIAHQIALASVKEIDRLNILQASLLAMRRAVMGLKPLPQLCLVDGNQPIPGLEIEQYPIIQGDRRFLAIAAASILAKVWRDQFITRLAARYPHYDLANNKGYGTATHRLALQNYGASRHHRGSFRPCRPQSCELTQTADS